MKRFTSSRPGGAALLLSFFLLALSVPAQATDMDALGVRASFKACMDQSGEVASSTNDCMDVELDYQNSRLEQVYKQLMAGFDSAGQEQMRQAEQAWSAMMGAYCNQETESGAGQSLAAYSCTLNETAKRASVLEYMNQHKETARRHTSARPKRTKRPN